MPDERPDPGVDAILADVDATLSATRDGGLVIQHASGSIRVSTDGMRWWSLLGEAEARSFAERLAAIAEDPRIILAATDFGDFGSESPAKMARRDIEVTPRR